MSSGTPVPVQPTIFREYIGAKPGSLTDFPDIINPDVEEFHYILAFATEAFDETTKTGTGTFTPRWDLSVFNAESVRRLKESHKNKKVKVKVVISIGGRGLRYSFNPADRKEWLRNAVDSLRGILRTFNNLIDGIDVKYENINAPIDDFVWRIGELIRSLKNKDLIKLACISPSNPTQAAYLKLYQTYPDYIDWVNYQFYDEIVPSKEYFEDLYRQLSKDYPKKLLPGVSTDPSDHGGISKEVFLKGCQRLFVERLLPGIFVWVADDSKPCYEVEKLAQQMITDFSLAQQMITDLSLAHKDDN